MSHLTHLSHSGSVHGQNDSKYVKNETETETETFYVNRVLKP